MVEAQKAVTLAPTNGLNLLALGEALAATGEEAAAKAAHAKAAEVGRARGDADGLERAAEAEKR